MSGYQGWTLEEHEKITPLNIRDNDLNHIIQGMQQTGFHKWGFVIYRCTYSDDDAWRRYVQYIRDETIRALDFLGVQFLLEKYFDIEVVEDRDQLDGASKPLVKSLFADRAARDRQTEQGGPGTATSFAKMIPRFNYCVYVDQACLDTLLKREEWDREFEQGGHQTEAWPFVICAVIDTDCDPEGEGREGYEPVEGCTRYFPGWMYCVVDFLPGLYNRLHFEELTDGYRTYERPPAVPNADGQRMPL
ncbi:hypothetical protein S40285_08764 [Stachybotrys chlorohalonatus IBT 40285]|uniref:Uncharacterized protein n=1 Tax=Stachybotrys chlorohalonatus (strain IBT 40285) TaxID=1283841 RepID=A0A084Q7T5_STAC4|nr:hypothetical protein S40285_08764 [Stachybotrys chlorohalonata IBT 40285]